MRAPRYHAADLETHRGLYCSTLLLWSLSLFVWLVRHERLVNQSAAVNVRISVSSRHRIVEILHCDKLEWNVDERIKTL